MDDKARYALYRSMNGKCHHCGTRLEWDAFQVRGLSGGWIVEEDADSDPPAQALCYKCSEFEGRGKAARKLVINEDIKRATKADDEPEPAAEEEGEADEASE